MSDAIPAIQSVADHVDKNIQKARNKQKLVELSSGGAASLLLAHRNLIYQKEVRCDNKKKSTVFFVFNDLLVHLSAIKAKHKPNLTLPEAQWPLNLIWMQFSSDSVQLIGPTDDVYIIKLNSDSLELIDNLRGAVNADLLKRHEKRKASGVPPTLDTPERYGAFQFPNSVYYEGDWLNGMVSKL